LEETRSQALTAQAQISLLCWLFACHAQVLCAETLGLFEANGDVGKPAKVGSARFDSSTQSYIVSGGGANMWGTNDDFHFVWKRISGSISLSAIIEGMTNSGAPHRKACLMIRQSLSADSAYVDVALHRDGLTSLQWRENASGLTREVQSAIKGPNHLG